MQDNDQDQDEKTLSDLYAELSQEQPSSELDDKVLAEAHKAVKPVEFGKKSAGPFSGQWKVPVSLAAVIVLSVSVVVMIEKERPYSLTSLPDQPKLERSVEPELLESDRNSQKQQKLEVQRMVEAVPPKADSPVVKRAPAVVEALDPAAVSAAKPPSKMKSAVLDSGQPAETAAPLPDSKPKEEKKLSKPTPDRKVVIAENKAARADAETDELTKNIEADADDSVQTAKQAMKEPAELSAEQDSKPPVPMRSMAAAASQAKVSGQAGVAADQLVEEESRSSESMDTEKAGSAADDATREQPITGDQSFAIAEQKASSKESKATAQTAIEENIVSSRQSIMAEPADEKPEQPASPLADISSESLVGATAAQMRKKSVAACAQMSVADCVSSSDCILQWQSEDKSYFCREPDNACEQNFVQSSNDRQGCENREGCEFVPANCFCLPGTQCDCSDGPPAMCRAITISE